MNYKTACPKGWQLKNNTFLFLELQKFEVLNDFFLKHQKKK